MTETVLITGSSSGIGRATARWFQARGWNVAATMRTPEKETELQALPQVAVTRLDITDPESIADAVDQTLSRFQRIDVLVNNAGIGAHGYFEQYDAEDARRLYELDVFGTMNVCRSVLPHMRAARKGRVINVTSVAGLVGTPGNTLYSGCKFALEGFTEALAMEYAAWGIKACTVAPGSFATNFNAAANDGWDRRSDDYGDHARKVQAYLDEMIAHMRVAGGRESHPDDVAEVIYRCATEARPIHNVAGADATGLAIALEGGRQAFIDSMIEQLPKLEA